jgi:hypothetical protein
MQFSDCRVGPLKTGKPIIIEGIISPEYLLKAAADCQGKPAAVPSFPDLV